jgi:F-type H+-transporting ATPase subunit delta
VRRDLAVAKPYARALHDLAKERGQVDAIARDLGAITAFLREDRTARAFFTRPWVGAGAKRAVAVEIATRLGLSPLARDFVGLVARQGRAEHLDAIEAAYQGLVDQDLGRVRARVRTAVPLTEDERRALRRRLGQALSGQAAASRRDGGRPLDVVLEEVVDPQLLGGFVAEIDSFIVDGSLDGQLARLRERIAQP